MIELLSAGMYTSIQDLGRFGFRKYGVPISGAMDGYAARLANRLLGNDDNCAVMEMTFVAPILYFHKDVTITLTGAAFTPLLDGVEKSMNVPLLIPAGSKLGFKAPSYGVRACLAVSGGFEVPKVLGSASFYKGITEKEKLHKGEVLQVNNTFKKELSAYAKIKLDKLHFNNNVLEVFKGPEFSELDPMFSKKIFKSDFTVSSQSSRMAYLLEGTAELSAREIITAPVQPGTVQLTPSGKLIVLMRDAQTTGGYARILQLTENSVNRLAQKRAGEKVSFQLIS